MLSDKSLTLKTVMLIALTSATRSSGIHCLDIESMEMDEQKITFTYGKLHKSWRQGKKPPKIVFHHFKEDSSICVVKAIKDYVHRSSIWRNKNVPSQLFLSHTNPHKPVSSDTIARWLKETLKDAGINTDIFTAHSTRSASTSKAKAQGATIEEILNRGTWSSKTHTWQKYYRKEVVRIEDQGKNFQEKIYNL